MSDYDPYAPRPLSGLARGQHDPYGATWMNKVIEPAEYTEDGRRIRMKGLTEDKANMVRDALKHGNEVRAASDGTFMLLHADHPRYNQKRLEKMNDETFEIAWELMKSDEKGDNAPTNPGLWAQAKSKARSKFKVYPSAYANGWAAKWYKSKGGGWKKKGKKGKKVKKSDDEGWTDNDLQCRMCKYVQTPEEWEAKNCKMCGTKNMIHPFWR